MTYSNEFFRKRPEKIEACSKFEYIFQFNQKKICTFFSDFVSILKKKLFIIYGSNCSYLIRATLPKL